jgi:DNA-binding response OmpR family regulator
VPAAQADAATADIPIIFMTAEDDIQAKVEGVRAGRWTTSPSRCSARLVAHSASSPAAPPAEGADHKTQGAVAQEHRAGSLPATIAHSLKTPLAAATRFLEILSKFKADNLSQEQRHRSTRR